MLFIFRERNVTSKIIKLGPTTFCTVNPTADPLLSEKATVSMAPTAAKFFKLLSFFLCLLCLLCPPVTRFLRPHTPLRLFLCSRAPGQSSTLEISPRRLSHSSFIGAGRKMIGASRRDGVAQPRRRLDAENGYRSSAEYD
ncbi:hypothetical protein BT93_B0149 [Corymbia citriodora subsp. variegata]|nr:hypothetical protein BT93_B0149 [Corymbia citriodora subsp. variegata]